MIRLNWTFNTLRCLRECLNKSQGLWCNSLTSPGWTLLSAQCLQRNCKSNRDRLWEIQVSSWRRSSSQCTLLALSSRASSCAWPFCESSLTWVHSWLCTAASLSFARWRSTWSTSHNLCSRAPSIKTADFALSLWCARDSSSKSTFRHTNLLFWQIRRHVPSCKQARVLTYSIATTSGPL